MPAPELDDVDMQLDMLMNRWPATIHVFIRHKMLCVGCMISPFHTIYDACLEYGLDVEDFILELRDAVRFGTDGLTPA